MLLRPSVCRLSVTYVFWLNDASYSKEVAYRKSTSTKMNDLDLCLEVIKVMSTIASHSHSPLNISETVIDTSLVPKDH